MKRRDFIQKAGLFTGGMLLHHQMIQAFGSLNTERVINVGIIGCGDRGNGITTVLNAMPLQFKVVAICDTLDFRLAEAKILNPGAVSYKEYKKLLDDRSVEAVIIATPLNLHFQIALDSLEAGKQVYLEKTMTYTAQQAIELAKRARKYPKQVLQIGHQYRYTPLYFKVKEMIDKGYLGKVTQIDCRWDRNWDWRRPVPQGLTDRQINWRMYREYSGGLAAELLSHQIDFINWAFNTHPSQVLATGGIDFYKDGRETFDNIQATLRYDKDNMIGNFGATCANSKEGYIFKIKGSRDSVSLLVNEGIFYPEPETKKQLETVDGVTSATKIEWNRDGGIPILKEKSN